MSVTGHQPSDYSALREKIDRLGIDWYVSGGQSINLWAERYDTQIPAMRHLFYPYTSSDIDISILDPSAAPVLASVLSTSINTIAGNGLIGALPDNLGEVLYLTPGLTPGQVENGMITLDNSWSVLDPVCCTKSKLWNVVNIPQKERRDFRHLQMLKMIVPEFLSDPEFDTSHSKNLLGYIKKTGVIESLEDEGLLLKTQTEFSDIYDSVPVPDKLDLWVNNRASEDDLKSLSDSFHEYNVQLMDDRLSEHHLFFLDSPIARSVEGEITNRSAGVWDNIYDRIKLNLDEAVKKESKQNTRLPKSPGITMI